MSQELHGFGFVLPHWFYWGWLVIMPIILMFFTRRRGDAPAVAPAPDEALDIDLLAEEDPALHAPGNRFTRVVDWISNMSGIFVAFWTVNAVCAYFYEVVMRYLFNMPTIWVHESSYLLFGMQYLLAGAFALLHGAHVRVDILYVKLPVRGRVGMDIFTSVFFFIFAAALMGTSWKFFMNSYGMGETTVETWGIQYWPVKGMMLLGAILITLAGLSKLIKDIQLFRSLGEEV
ncbi:TRAP transporter small permease subunit [Thioalbus denitrificans]|uniref:TRAP transporter small permease protein n=1 Tax=Thioalbus denitrificans TaxID=547122 RepID=A0A369CE21_9GAMM|nr:TRAP transporter small permease subunit [Thioalbus denitrificans]RCX31811.1 TRAP-type mannitol/chloroaromatic compound transport system permease small subunit [Thioalbus denitrificans]